MNKGLGLMQKVGLTLRLIKLQDILVMQ